MRLKLLIALFLGASLSVSAQAPVNSDARKINPNGEVSNAQRYGHDYELVEYNFEGDSTILDKLDLQSIEYLRHDTMDQVYRDQINHVAILLYSRKRMNADQPLIHK